MPTERRNITQPPDWWKAFEAAAESEGMRLSEWLGDAGWHFLPRDVRKSLSRRLKPGEQEPEGE